MVLSLTNPSFLSLPRRERLIPPPSQQRIIESKAKNQCKLRRMTRKATESNGGRLTPLVCGSLVELAAEPDPWSWHAG